MLRVQRLLSERVQRVIVDQPFQIAVIQLFNALHFVGGAETVEAVHKRVPAADGGQMGHRAQVHGLLGEEDISMA